MCGCAQAAWAQGAPADRLPAPRPEPCIPFDLEADVEEGEMLTPTGLSYEQVTLALSSVIQTALYCQQPSGFDKLHLTFELLVGCDGRVAQLEATEDDGAPADYIACVSAVIAKADLPAHDVADGFPITYPVNVAW